MSVILFAGSPSVARKLSYHSKQVQDRKDLTSHLLSGRTFVRDLREQRLSFFECDSNPTHLRIVQIFWDQ